LFIGPRWTLAKAAGTNSGLMTSITLGPTWLLHAGAFRSVDDIKTNFTNLLVDEQPDGTGDHVIFADPRLVSRSLSGELRLRHSIADGPRLHIVQLSLRERDARHQFGGSDELDLGPGSFLQSFEPPKPDLNFGAISRDHVRQTTIGLAYDGRWKNVGELSISIARASYRKTTALPEAPIAVSRSTPLLYDATLAADLNGKIVAYAGYAKGLEDSGLAPPTAANRNEPLPAILTQQADAGLRIQIAPKLRAVAGVFDLQRPTFGFDAGNRFLQIGTTRSRGAEFSLSGSLSSRLNLLAGGVLLDPKVSAQPGIPGTIGPRPAGIPSRTLNASLNWRTPFARGLELDVALYQRGRTPSTTDNKVFLPAWTDVDLGAHYKFKLANHSAALRLRVRNIFNDQGLLYQGPGIYGINFGRYGLASLTIDS
jgi:iron complex outermembrane receptor protein